jgi:thiamine biosynthesis lipoprotein
MQSATNGSFEYRLMTLINLWGFGEQQKSKIPAKNKINRVLKQIASSNIDFNKLEAQKSFRNLKIDLDGIAQGYCVDELSNFLQKRGIKDYVVELGGELVVSGTDLDNSSWEIGLGEQQVDFKQTKQSFVLSGMNQMGITSSGSLQKFKKIGDQYFSHIIDPRSGYPVQNGIVSVTVIAPTAMQADALDNAFMVLGIKDSFEWCSRYSNIGFYISYVNPKGELVDTANAYFKQFLQIKNRN